MVLRKRTSKEPFQVSTAISSPLTWNGLKFPKQYALTTVLSYVTRGYNYTRVHGKGTINDPCNGVPDIRNTAQKHSE